MEIKTLAALSDNYIYLITQGCDAFVVDPGDAEVVLSELADNNRRLSGVLVTHRHTDHIGGLAVLREAYPDAIVYAPDGCGIAGASIVQGGQRVEMFGESLQVVETPGHTLEHIAYVAGGFMFSGDTLFIGGCGRVFEGTMQQMQQSLAALAAFPDDTMIYCGHEYTRANLHFAAAVEPDNINICSCLQSAEDAIAAGRLTIPGTLAMERKTNPYLRLREAAVIAAAENRTGERLVDDVAVFAALREWKNNF